jgi:SPP1 gp7 family putative phage head morphogenesis protein
MPIRKPPLEFEEAVRWLRQRVPILDDEFYALDAQAKRKAFTVSGVAQLDLVNDIMRDLENAVSHGVPLNEFKAAVQQKLMAAWGGTVKRPGHRIETIYRTNTQLAYGAGRYAQLTNPDALKVRPVWVYDAVLDSRTTETCRERHGITKLASDEWWNTNYPPLHHRCRSGVRAIRSGGAELTENIPDSDPNEGFGLTPGLDEWKPTRSKYATELWTRFSRKIGASPRLRPSNFVQTLHSSLTDEQTDQVTDAIDDLGLGHWMEGPGRLKLLAIIPSWASGQLHIDMASGLTFGPNANDYPAIFVRAVTRPDRIPMGEETLRPGLSDGVAVVSSAVGYMKAVLAHELGHHVWNEGGDDVRQWVIAAFAVGNPITKLAADDEQEYLCECFAAYAYYRNALKKHDQVGYNLVKKIVRHLKARS